MSPPGNTSGVVSVSFVESNTPRDSASVLVTRRKTRTGFVRSTAMRRMPAWSSCGARSIVRQVAPPSADTASMGVKREPWAIVT